MSFREPSTELQAHVPFRCLLPQGIEGLLVTGLGISAHRDAIPVVRMQADVQNHGYAAGLAAAMSAGEQRRLRDLDMRHLQEKLVGCGILDSSVLQHEDSPPLSVEEIREAVLRGPVDVFSAAVIFAHTAVSLPLLLEQLGEDTDPGRQENAALILGLCGRPEPAQNLAAIVASREWDEGWDYRGMGQFGPSMSRLDALIIALGKTRSPVAIAPVLEKIRALTAMSAFSHCRAVSIAASALADPRLAVALYDLLQQPGMQGHAHISTAEVVAHANDDLNETETRNASLKELLLGRGLFLCGDYEGLGREILRKYSNDLRGHYARHAQAVLTWDDPAQLRGEVM